MKITYKGETRNIPDQYIKGLKGKDREKQIKSIFEGTVRPKTKAPEKGQETQQQDLTIESPIYEEDCDSCTI